MKTYTKFLIDAKRKNGFDYIKGKKCTECGNDEYKLGYRGSIQYARCSKCGKEVKAKKIK